MQILAKCPRCGRQIQLGARDSCAMIFRDGKVCGFSLPITYSGASKKFREKCCKHSDPSVSGNVSTVTSYVDSLTDYERFQEYLFMSGSLYVDPQGNTLVLATHPYSAATPTRGSTSPTAARTRPLSGP